MTRSSLAAVLVAALALAACSGGAGQGSLPSMGSAQQPAGVAQQPAEGQEQAEATPAVGQSPEQSPLQVASSLEELTPAHGYYPLTKPGAARPVCPQTKNLHAARCYAWIRTDLRPSFAGIRPGTNGIPSNLGYTPADIQAAYQLNPALGGGQTVFIIDAYGYPQANTDLATYRAAAGLPACTTANGCLKILNQNGQAKPLPPTNASWTFEQSLDLDAVSGACPKCKIVLIQGSSTVLESAIERALTLHAKIVSMSFGFPEEPPADPGLPTSGAAYVASAGDNGGGTKAGGGPSMPCTYAAVICAGGTRLTGSGTSWSETVWNDEAIHECGSTGTSPCGATGSACSQVVPRPSWQSGACSMRAAADVAAVASPLTPYAIYNTPICGGWCSAGGTSLSAPLISGIIALAGNASSRHGAMEIWQSHSSLKNVTSGTNVYVPVTGPCASKVKATCVAGPGYNGPTGWGTPEGVTDF